MEPTAATLLSLADSGATGALVVPGPQRGTVFLVEGLVTYVEADDVPGLDARCARRARADGRPEPIGAVTRSATLDAAVAALARPATGPAQFHAGVTHPAGQAAPLGVDALLAAVAAGVDALTRAAVGPDDELTLRRADRDGVRLVGRQLAVLVGFTEGATPRELAWRAGEAILDTVAAVGDLVGQGACAVTTRRPRPVPGPDGAGGTGGPDGAAGGAVTHGGSDGTDDRSLGLRYRRRPPTPSPRAASRRVVPRDIPGEAPPDAARAVTGPLAPLARAAAPLPTEPRPSDDTGRGSGRTPRHPGGPAAGSGPGGPVGPGTDDRDAATLATGLPRRTARPVPAARRATAGWPAAFARPDHDVYVRLLDGLRRR